jgi:taurine dioxygenase
MEWLVAAAAMNYGDSFQQRQHPAVGIDLRIRKLAPALGVEITVNLVRPLSDVNFQKIRSAWEQHCVALFRGQQLSLIKQMRFASRFGAIGRTGHGPPALLEVSNARDADGPKGILPDGPIDFHSDQSYLDTPSMGTLLYALDIPGHGGDTLFGNVFLAFQALPPDIKQRLAGRQALHVYDYETHPTRRPRELPPNALRAVHPIFRLHPPTGRTALYVNRLMTWSIVDMDPAESRETLQYLFEHQERAEFVHTHRWEPGDLVLWDNRSCIHARTDFDPSESRRLRRITVLNST